MAKKRKKCSPLLLLCHCSDLPQWQGQPQWCLEARQGGILIAIITIHNDIHCSISSFLFITRSASPSMWPSMNNFSMIFIYLIFDHQVCVTLHETIHSSSPSRRVSPQSFYLYSRGKSSKKESVRYQHTLFIFWWFLISNQDFPRSKRKYVRR